jgi:alpha-beta hydrolase superfamily lysophospholipase
MLIEAARNAVPLLSASSLPVVFHHGADDIVTLPAGAEWCHANWSTAKGATKALHIHAGLRHELFSEPIKGAEVCRHAAMPDSEHHKSYFSLSIRSFLVFCMLAD